MKILGFPHVQKPVFHFHIRFAGIGRDAALASHGLRSVRTHMLALQFDHRAQRAGFYDFYPFHYGYEDVRIFY